MYPLPTTRRPGTFTPPTVSNRIGRVWYNERVDTDTFAGNPEELSDELLVQECRQGRADAFDAIVNKYRNRVFNVAYRMTGSHDAAGELAQETFVRAYKGLKGFRGNSSLLTWMYSILSNACKNRFRYNARRGGGVTISLDEAGYDVISNASGDGGSNPARELQRKELGEIIQKAISALPENFRSALVLKDIDGMCYEDISVSIGCDVGTVKSRLHRARYMLREKLKGYRI